MSATRKPPSGDHPTLLEVTDLSKAYGAIQAVDGVSFEVQPGEIFGVIGPNGSGKTTLFNSMLGQITPDAGRIELERPRHHRAGAEELNQRGVGRTFQTLQVFGKMSVRDNLIVAAQEHRGTMWSPHVRARRLRARRQADALIDQFRIRHVADQQAGELSYGQQKLVDIAMAFMSEPRPGAARRALRRRQPEPGRRHQHAAQGAEPRAGRRQNAASFVVIEHNMDFVMDLCHRILVMVEGKVMAIGTPAEIRANKQVLDAYLGS